MTQPATDELRLSDDPAASRFEARTPGGEVAGYAEYRRGASRMVFTHTVVEPRFEGRGVASALIRFALDDTRGRGLAVKPICPFVRSFIARHADYQALLDEPLADGS